MGLELLYLCSESPISPPCPDVVLAAPVPVLTAQISQVRTLKPCLLCGDFTVLMALKVHM